MPPNVPFSTTSSIIMSLSRILIKLSRYNCWQQYFALSWIIVFCGIIIFVHNVFLVTIRKLIFVPDASVRIAPSYIIYMTNLVLTLRLLALSRQPLNVFTSPHRTTCFQFEYYLNRFNCCLSNSRQPFIDLTERDTN